MAAVVLLAGAGCSPRTGADYVRETDRWHAGRIERLLAPDGWLTLVGLHPLVPGSNSIGSAAGNDVRLVPAAPPRVGVLEIADGSLLFTAAPEAGVTTDADGAAAPAAAIELASDAAGEPTVLRTGTISFHVIARGDRLFLRVKDSDSRVRREFRGIERFPVSSRWRVRARLEPDASPRTIEVPNALGRIDREPTCGVLVFSLEGRECRLRPIGGAGEPLFIVFSDRTSGAATYGGGRFLSAGAPGPDGTVVLDFNRAVNPPCVFTDFATCPLPPEGNDLPLPVEAGERMWGEGH